MATIQWHPQVNALTTPPFPATPCVPASFIGGGSL